MGAPSHPGFKLDRTFFGLEPHHRINLHNNLFELMWHGQGRWDWNTLYNMPIFLRKFWLKKLNEKLDVAEQRQTSNKTSTKTVKRPPRVHSKYKK